MILAEGSEPLRISLADGFHHLFHSERPLRYDIQVNEREITVLRISE